MASKAKADEKNSLRLKSIGRESLGGAKGSSGKTEAGVCIAPKDADTLYSEPVLRWLCPGKHDDTAMTIGNGCNAASAAADPRYLETVNTAVQTGGAQASVSCQEDAASQRDDKLVSRVACEGVNHPSRSTSSGNQVEADEGKVPNAPHRPCQRLATA